MVSGRLVTLVSSKLLVRMDSSSPGACTGKTQSLVDFSQVIIWFHDDKQLEANTLLHLTNGIKLN